MSTIVIRLQPDEDPSKLLDLTREHVAAGSTLHIVSFVTILAEEDVHPGLERAQRFEDGLLRRSAARVACARGATVTDRGPARLSYWAER